MLTMNWTKGERRRIMLGVPVGSYFRQTADHGGCKDGSLRRHGSYGAYGVGGCEGAAGSGRDGAGRRARRRQGRGLEGERRRGRGGGRGRREGPPGGVPGGRRRLRRGAAQLRVEHGARRPATRGRRVRGGARGYAAQTRGALVV